ncbi:hypothetical protein [Mucilaginibacter endophyticus]|uniref:hypothetical protein n=1 Tax=Mucilaginibacter endophyticus TaxID=2675003 RepID=UPI000E0D36C6|nr:hypothetical protein [Mucilaginibacter endophyticus]
MKKQLLWGVLLLLAGFSSCQKDSFKPVNDESAKGKSTKVNTGQPTYTYADLALQPRQPGETFDTYKGVWSGAEVKVIGTPVWNQAAYPTLVNGVPALGASYGVYSNGTQITTSTVAGQDFFALTIGLIDLQGGQKFRDAMKAYQVATYNSNSSTPPSIDSFLAGVLTNSPDSYTVTGKLIRVTTGSHWALASINYPTPTPVAIPTLPAHFETAFVYPAGSPYEYDIIVDNGAVTSVKGYNRTTFANFNVTSFSGGFVSIIAASSYYISDITVTPQGGSTFVFNGKSTDLE